MQSEISLARPNDLIAQFTRSAPVDLNGLAAALGIDVAYVALESDISGKIEADWWGKVEISVNANHPVTRQRFTLAHEIGHFVLHREHIGDGIIDDALYRSSKSSAIERQANSFAASLLMPAPLVRAAFQSGRTSAESLARSFQVSPAVAEIRMRELRLS